MRLSLKAFAIATLAGAILAGPLSSSSLAAKSGAQRYTQGHHGNAALGRYASRISRCERGRYYTYGGGWGCDYYRYVYDWPLGRR